MRVSTFPVGEWDGGRLADADPTHLGLLVAEGVLAPRGRARRHRQHRAAGPGDIIRPWHIDGPPELLPVAVRWNALSPIRLGLIDRRVAAVLGRYPEVSAVIVDRLSERAQRLAITQAISQLNRVDRRLLALFWHLAERWGRVARDGIAVPLVLSHRLIGELVGARRPTVSTALAELARDGQLSAARTARGCSPASRSRVPAEAAIEVIRQRRRLMPSCTSRSATDGGAARPRGRPATRASSSWAPRCVSSAPGTARTRRRPAPAAARECAGAHLGKARVDDHDFPLLPLPLHGHSRRRAVPALWSLAAAVGPRRGTARDGADGRAPAALRRSSGAAELPLRGFEDRHPAAVAALVVAHRAPARVPSSRSTIASAVSSS